MRDERWYLQIFHRDGSVDTFGLNPEEWLKWKKLKGSIRELKKGNESFFIDMTQVKKIVYEPPLKPFNAPSNQIEWNRIDLSPVIDTGCHFNINHALKCGTEHILIQPCDGRCKAPDFIEKMCRFSMAKPQFTGPLMQGCITQFILKEKCIDGCTAYVKDKKDE